MDLSKILGVLLILLSMLFLGLQSLGQEHYAFGVKAIGMSMLVVLYCIGVKKKHVLFMLFLIAYSAAEVHNYITYNMFPHADATYDLHYLIGNTLYITAYVFLILRIFSIMDFKKAISRFPFQTG
ncbi:MAG: drug/metabolite transporter (DMT)-like permease, partial [Glaciecola sp.]